VGWPHIIFFNIGAFGSEARVRSSLQPFNSYMEGAFNEISRLPVLFLPFRGYRAILFPFMCINWMGKALHEIFWLDLVMICERFGGDL